MTPAWRGCTLLYRNFTTQEELDEQYDVEAGHPDISSVGAMFERLSIVAQATLDWTPDVRFGPTRDEHVDVYRASGAGPRPVLLFIHGGWWRRFSSKTFALVASGPVAAGVDVVVTNYSLAPKASIDEITRQSRAAVAWVREHAPSWGGDPDRIFVSGHSAGGHQVGMLLGTDWVGEYDLPPDVIKGGISISGLFDLRPFPYTWLAPALQLSHRTIETQSPLFHIPESAPPILLTYGGRESREFHRQSEDYLSAWRRAGLTGEAFKQTDADHFTAITGLADPGSDLTRRVLSFIGHDPAGVGARP
ncbi:MAG: arylformamidase [Solirubrobacteraceae bacterium]|nr:arylformamidase [Solirubrobacteraceae bacterium]